MDAKLQVPDELQPAFRRIVRKIPADLRNDNHLLEMIVIYLKMGGERLAKQALEVAKVEYREMVNQKRKERRREAMLRVVEAAIEQQSGNTADPGEEDPEQNEGYGDDENNINSNDYFT
jgi:hypothetical protein